MTRATIAENYIELQKQRKKGNVRIEQEKEIGSRRFCNSSKWGMTIKVICHGYENYLN